MKIKRKWFAVEPVPVKYVRSKETYSCNRFYIWHNPVDRYYELGIFDEELRHKVKEYAAESPDSIRVVDDFSEMDTNTATYVYVEESSLEITIKSPAELLTNSNDNKPAQFRSMGTMVKVFAGETTLYDKLTRWALEYPSVVYGNVTPGEPYGFPSDDEFMIPVEMLNIVFIT